jgi:hypothetical protein
MSTVNEPKAATKTRPIGTRYDDAPDSARGVETTGVLLGPPPR